MRIGEEVLYLSRSDVISVGLTPEECVDILEEAHRAKARDEVEMPRKPIIGDPLGEGFMCAYPARIGRDRIGVKWLGGRPGNGRAGLAQINALIILNDPETFFPIAVMDGTAITGMRTAGVSGIALRHLARPESEVCAVLGCGFEGETHAHIVAAVCPGVKKILAWSPNIGTSERYAGRMRERTGLEVEAVPDAEAAVRAADIVVSSTPLGAPERFALLHGNWLREGVTSVSISRANHFYPDAFFAFDSWYVDDRETMALAALRPGFERCAELPARELGTLLQKGCPGRQHDREKILFMSEGVAINDVAVGTAVYRRAVEKGIGTVLRL